MPDICERRPLTLPDRWDGYEPEGNVAVSGQCDQAIGHPRHRNNDGDGRQLVSEAPARAGDGGVHRAATSPAGQASRRIRIT
jgi:hypothetical protein